MTLREKLGQLMIIGLEGPELTEREVSFITQNNIGGVILMGRNCQSPKQIHALVSSVQSLRHKTTSKSPLFVAVDMEGGRVARLKEPFTQWPPAQKVGEIDSPSLAFNMAMLMGRELRAVGINLDFAPCVDVLTNPDNKVIGNRSLSSDPEVVSKMSSALIRGFVKSEVLTCAKHFPGHGHTLVDSHEDLPVEEVSLDQLHSVELVPFKKAIRSRVNMIMMSHILFKNIDGEFPASLSEVFVNQILRQDLRYRGLIVTDDLDMKALTHRMSVEDIAVRALQVGNDLLLYCNEADVPPKALVALEQAAEKKTISLLQIEHSLDRVQRAKKDFLTHADPPSWSEAEKWIGHADHLRIAQAIAEGRIPEGLAQGA